MDYSPPGSSVQGIFQARILEWVAIPFSRGYSRPRNRIQVFRIADRFFTVWATRKAEAYNLSRICLWSQTAIFQTPKSRRLIIWQQTKKLCSQKGVKQPNFFLSFFSSVRWDFNFKKITLKKKLFRLKNLLNFCIRILLGFLAWHLLKYIFI